MNEMRNVYNCDSKAIVTGHSTINGKLNVNYYFKHDPSKSYSMPVKEFDSITY